MSNRQARTSAREARARVQEEGQAATNQGVATGQEEEEEDEEEEEQHRRKRARKDTREWCVFPIGKAARVMGEGLIKGLCRLRVYLWSARTCLFQTSAEMPFEAYIVM